MPVFSFSEVPYLAAQNRRLTDAAQEGEEGIEGSRSFHFHGLFSRLFLLARSARSSSRILAYFTTKVCSQEEEEDEGLSEKSGRKSAAALENGIGAHVRLQRIK